MKAEKHMHKYMHSFIHIDVAVSIKIGWQLILACYDNHAKMHMQSRYFSTCILYIKSIQPNAQEKL